MTQTEKTTKKEQTQALTFANFSYLGQIQQALTKEQLQFIRETLAPTLSDKQLLLFMYKAHRLGLDPLNNEIFAYQNKDGQMVTIIAKDGKLRLAKETKHLGFYNDEPIYRLKEENGRYIKVELWEGGELWGATASVERVDEGKTYTRTVPLSEFKKNNAQWQTMPETMIKKVALSQCLSKAFPELFSGVYEDAEIEVLNGTQSGSEYSVALPESPTDNEPATDAQKKSVATLAQKASFEVDVESMTQRQAREFLAQQAAQSVKKGNK